MKKNRLNIILIVILVIIALYVFINHKRSTIPKELRDFAVEDTASIDKIFMVTKENQQVLLERNNNNWMVNEKYYARKDAITMLLATMHNLSDKEPVAKSLFKTVVSNLAVKSIKVEIYQKGKLKKIYYVGGPTKNKYGTYMLLENSSQPFVMEIKGFKGYLTPRYFVDENQWRDRTIFKYNFSEIASVKVELPLADNESFKVTNLGDNHYKLESLNGKSNIVGFDTIKVKQYLASFKRISFDSFVKYIEEEKKDSVLASIPHYIITVKQFNGNQKEIKTFYRPNDGIINSEGTMLKYDPDHEYAIIDNDDEMILIQYFVFDLLFKKISYFQPKFELE